MAARTTQGMTPAIAFVGTIVPDEPGFHGPAFNRAAQMFQEGLLTGLADAGLPPDVVFSIEPTPAFPRGQRLVGRSGSFATGRGSVRLLPFVNLHPIKWMSAGLTTFVALVLWSWRHRGRPRLIHCINLSMPPGIFVWLAARLTGARTLVSVLDVFRPGALTPDTLYRRLDFAMQRWLMPRYDGHMVVSDAIAEDFLPGRAVCRLEGGVVPGDFANREPSPVGRDGSVFRVVLSGSLESHNGIEVALDAASRLPSRYQFVFAGLGTFAGTVRDRALRDSSVKYLGFLSFKEVLDLYSSADLLLNLRLTHAVDTRYFFPSKLMELLASGTPVASTCTGHTEQEYGDVLYLLRDETPQALADRIAEIAELPSSERQVMGRRGREFILSEKTWPRQGERLARYIRTEVLRST